MSKIKICNGVEPSKVFKDKNGKELKLNDEFMLKGKKHSLLLNSKGKMQIYVFNEKFGVFSHPYLYERYDELELHAVKL
ncbi:hypothetical protein [Helicobacter trogontum]|uniref:Uncharacterized protein n=1 Tax=Helicobacter trogontum TaxID=50960 RepID=A0A4V6HYZ9_9HELI|nr:hypothetical protein [Helicobacter trogontum]TLD82502.1 hypothetical protein LS81_007880 [Helicobacter trogontum]